MLHEPAVAITDLLLAAENAVLAVIVARRAQALVRAPFVGFFAALAVASAAGAAVHGFGWQPRQVSYIVFWRLTLLAIAVASASALLVCGRLTSSRAGQIAATIVIGVAAIVIATNVYHLADEFEIAVALYVPALFALLACFGRMRQWFGFIGILLTFAATGVQQSAFHMGLLDHNALYHVVEAVALAFIAIAAIRSERPNPRR